ncbi:MAG: dephospho-CoA kinase [Candidatus Krumholzibacteria bacterium]|nr:dephospho-CoA kinase [Candidatus Krumholzibacteria bacterium]
MRVPVIGVTGPIASGKTTVAKTIAAAGGVLIDCDALGKRALEAPEVRKGIVAAFGAGVLGSGGAVSRRRLARIVFASDRDLERLNRIVRTSLKRIITDEVLKRRVRAPYIVLDAVLLFQYKFRFKVDYAVVTRASRRMRLARIMRRDGVSRSEAAARIERQRKLESGWAMADASIATDGPLARVRSEAGRIRDRFLARPMTAERKARCRRSSRTGR